MSKTVEIRVRPVTRWIASRYEFEDRGDGRASGGSEGLGEFDSPRAANRVAEAIGAHEPVAKVIFAPEPHASDCALHNEPAEPNGPCDCGART